MTEKFRRRVRHGLLLGSLSAVALAGCHDVIEEHYLSTPDLPVTWRDSNPADDADPPEGFPPGQNPRCSGAFTYFYPTDLGGPNDTFKHPVLTWGNGTGSNACAYAPALLQLAAWGYVVVAANNASTGWGTEILAAANHLVQENANPSSVFHGKLDTNKIGAIGHSQGAGGAIRAAVLSSGLIKSVVALSLTDPLGWVPVGIPAPDTGQLSVPTFFVRGSNDFLATELGAALYYGGVPGAAAKASLKGAGHNDLQAARGYVTAWLDYTLKGDGYARGAFVGDPPEIVERSDAPEDAWENVALKNLP
jgi:pimeloyl-ACP methyl ester carboxylesterase